MGLAELVEAGVFALLFVLKGEDRMRGELLPALANALEAPGMESRCARDSLLMKALAAKGMPSAGRREEKSVRRAAEENVVPVFFEVWATSSARPDIDWDRG